MLGKALLKLAKVQQKKTHTPATRKKSRGIITSLLIISPRKNLLNSVPIIWVHERLSPQKKKKVSRIHGSVAVVVYEQPTGTIVFAVESLIDPFYT